MLYELLQLQDASGDAKEVQDPKVNEKDREVNPPHVKDED